MGSLLEIIIDNEIKFSIVDKIVIILEIASALNDMHFHGQYHGNLSNRMIYLNSSKDAYIGSICYNRESAYFSPVPLNEFYFQSPECFKNDGDFRNIEITKYNDIYSFGVMMHEIFTEKEIRLRFHDKQLRINQIRNILINNYSDFLFSDEKNEIFEEDYMVELKKIIQKCMMNDIKYRYSSFEEIIESIKSSTIYKNNRDEIEFRIEHAIDANDYACHFSDIVESYFRGKIRCKKIIINFIKFITFNMVQINEDDDLIKIIFDIFNKIEKDSFYDSLYEK